MLIKKYDPERVPKQYTPRIDDTTKTKIVEKIKSFVTEDKTYQEVREYLRKQEDIPKLRGHEANSFIKQVDDEWRRKEVEVNKPVEEPVKDPIEEMVK